MERHAFFFTATFQTLHRAEPESVVAEVFTQEKTENVGWRKMRAVEAQDKGGGGAGHRVSPDH